jgi:glycosyltransferase involved in cell wall biosynthesis
VLAEFLRSLRELDTTDLALDFIFVDDNDDPASTALLAAFEVAGEVTILPKGSEGISYQKDDVTHHWVPDLFDRVAVFKDRFIARAREGGYDGLFLVDSDLVLHRGTLQRLVTAGVAICSEIFWTRWQPDGPEMPQVWLRDQYSLFPLRPGESIPLDEAQRRTNAFLAQLRVPGVYEVGGLGACTLIGREALAAGVSFRNIPNLGLVGEDRHFCVRAAAMGIKLFVDTHLPALHLYRASDLERVAAFCGEVTDPVEGTRAMEETAPPVAAVPRPPWVADAPRKASGNRLVLSMLVRNESDRFLREILTHAARYVDAAVIVDDASTDDTVAVCREALREVPHTVTTLTESLFHRESELRAIQWQATLAKEPDWVLSLDADEVFEDAIRGEIRGLIDQTEWDAVAFRMYDFWDAEHYRDDEWWRAHHIYRPFLIRVLPGMPLDWPAAAQHAGRFPQSVMELPMRMSEVRLKHLGWSTARERHRKYERYRRLDPKAVYGVRAQYESILDLEPVLRRWEE